MGGVRKRFSNDLLFLDLIRFKYIMILNRKMYSNSCFINPDGYLPVSVSFPIENLYQNKNIVDEILKNPRPTWEQYFVEIVNIVKKRSPCRRLQVGCILVKDNRIISAGYNGFIAGCPHKSIIRDNHEMATIHAEYNAIADCAKRGVMCEGSVAYITHYPCIHCYKLLVASGISHIYYIEDYKNDKIVGELKEDCGVDIEKIDI